jgi:uncharacterized membrane protein YiaA
MARRRSSRSRRAVRLGTVERLLFIGGATLYLIGLFGGMRLLDMATTTALFLLALGGGLQLIVTLSLVF